MPRATVNGQRLSYHQAGAGPDVVLLRGRAGWPHRTLTQVLAADFRVTALDLRGRDDGDGPPPGTTSADLSDDLQGLAEALGLGPAYVVGYGFGGVVALHAAVLYPDHVAGVVVSETMLPSLPTAETSGPFEEAAAGLTLQRLVLVEQPVFALCGEHSRARAGCRFLETKLPDCKAFLVHGTDRAVLEENPVAFVELLQQQLRAMAGIAGEWNTGRRPGPPTRRKGPWSQPLSEEWDEHAVASWMLRVSAWGE